MLGDGDLSIQGLRGRPVTIEGLEARPGSWRGIEITDWAKEIEIEELDLSKNKKIKSISCGGGWVPW